MSTKNAAIARKAANGLMAAGLIAGMGAGALTLPDSAYADSTTALTIKVDQSAIAPGTNTGSGENMSVVIPVKIDYAAAADGTLTGAADGTVKIVNNSIIPVHVSNIKVTSVGNASIVMESDSMTADQVALKVKPGTGAEDEFGRYATASGSAPQVASDWNIPASGGELGLNSLTGKIGGYDKLNPTSEITVGEVHWTISAGKVVSGS